MSCGCARGLGVALLLLVSGATGCQRTDSNEELAQDWMDALNSHDPVRIVELLQPRASCTDAVADTPVDPAAYAQRLAAEWNAWKDRVYMTETIRVAPDFILIQWRIQQTHPTGKSVPLDGATVLDVQGGHISGVHDYYNATTYVQFVKAG